MNKKAFLPPLARRQRARNPRLREDPSAVFKTFVELLAQLRAEARGASHAPINGQAEQR
ncbi:MAG TPA: histidine kinase [Methylocystis sp.]|jgi:hypothetical protein